MLQKFENKSERVKGLSFHPKRPWLLASLHNGVIQLFDYRSRVLVDKFEEHQGPVRGISFHLTQPLFVSGGDDYKIKVWNYKQRKCLFTLHGHLDYVRTVFFHHESPWIVSASDDQTIRIWNWQSRNCLTILTGHNHYVMCAQFHPRDPLLVSASLDQTVRVWDLSGIKAKSTKPGAGGARSGLSVGGLTFEDLARQGGSSSAAAAVDLFAGGGGSGGGSSAGDVTVKFVLEGHDRGVNWASFHPTLPLIVSGADDRQIKIWRMSDHKAWEIDSLRGHHNNVSCVMFHPRQELLLSNAEDKSIRIWDIAKRQAITVFKSEHDRFWVLASHPDLNIFAAGHDNGFILFKLERERPAYAVHESLVFYVKDKFIRVFDARQGNDVSVATVRRPTGLNVSPKAISYNAAEKCILVTFANGNVELIMLGDSGDSVGESSSGEVRSFPGQAAVFVARNRYAILEASGESLLLRNVRNEASKQINSSEPGSFKASAIFSAGTAQILLAGPTGVRLLDLQQGNVLAELTLSTGSSPIKYAYWSDDGSQVALVAKTSIIIASKRLVQKAFILETSPIKSGAWDERGNVFIYSTLTHLKFTLAQGDNGIIKTLEQPLYVVKVVHGNGGGGASTLAATSAANATNMASTASVYCLDRDGKVRLLSIDPSEYQFKLALVKKQYDLVLDMIRKGSLIGQSVIAYLRRKGYPEVALMFVKEPKARFELAVECGNLEIAVEAAKSLNQEAYWRSLAEEGLAQGNQAVVEFAYQNIRAFDRLLTLYLVLGNTEKLGKMQRIAEARSDVSALFQTALITGNVTLQYDIYMAAGQFGLAYLLARNYALGQEKVEAALSGADRSPERIEPFTFPNRLLAPPVPLSLSNRGDSWPLANLSRGLFDAATAAATSTSRTIASENKDVVGDSLPVKYGKGNNNMNDTNFEKDEFEDALTLVDNVDDGAGAGGGWGNVPDVLENLDIDIPDDVIGKAVNGKEYHGVGVDSLVSPGQQGDGYFFEAAPLHSIADINVTGFLRNNRNPFHHAALGSFETAMQLLNQNLGIYNFEPFKELFMKAYHGNRLIVPSAVVGGLGGIQISRLGTGKIDSTKLLVQDPQSDSNVEMIDRILASGLQLTTQGRFGEAIELFRQILSQVIPMLPPVTKAQYSHIVDSVIPLARDYILALCLEGERKNLPDPVSARSAELSWLFTMVPRMQAVHLKLALRSAMAIHYKAGNFKTAGHFARRILELDSQDQVSIQAKKIIAFAQTRNEDPLPIPLISENASSILIDSVSYVASLNSREKSATFFYCCNCGAASSQQNAKCTVCQVSSYSANHPNIYQEGLTSILISE